MSRILSGRDFLGSHQSDWLELVLPTQNTEVTTIAPDPHSDRFHVGTVGEGVFVYEGNRRSTYARRPAPRSPPAAPNSYRRTARRRA